MNYNLTATQLEDEIKAAEHELVEPSGRAMLLWERIMVPASLWTSAQYTIDSTFWVIAIIGNRCLYFNFVEGGWGWGQYHEWGRIDNYHWQQDEIHHVVYQLLLAINNDEMVNKA